MTTAQPKAEQKSKRTSRKKTPAARQLKEEVQSLNYPELTKLTDLKAEEYCREFQAAVRAKPALVCFLLDFLPYSESAGLELAAFRRGELLRTYCGVEPWLLTNYYQPGFVENALRQIRLGRLSVAHIANLYDFVQGINRSALQKKQVELALNAGWKAVPVENTADFVVYDSSGQQLMYIHRTGEDHSIDYVNYIKEGKIVRRDTYDPLGFLSRTELINPEQNFTHSAMFFHPNGRLSLIETYRAPQNPGDRPVTDTINILDKNGFTIQRFTYRDELIAWWLLQLLGDKKTTYLCVADQLMDYQRYFVELKRQAKSYPNVRIAAVSHNCHTVDPKDVMHSTLGDNYRFICDPNQRMDRVITLTAWQRDDILARYGQQAHPISVIPHAIPYSREDASEKLSTPSDLPDHAIALVGRFAPAKNQALALELIKLVRAQIPDATLHFYGSGGMENEIRKQVIDQNLQEMVFFHGFVSDLKPVYKSVSLLVSMSEHEGLPLNIMEALSLGCPVVAFDCRYGPRELIADGKDGYLIPQGAVDALAQKVIALLSDDRLRADFSREAVEQANHLSPLRVASLWARLLTELLSD